MKAGVRRVFGSPTDQRYRLAGNFFGILSFLPVLGLVAALPDRQYYAIPSTWIYLMLGGQLMAAAALIGGIRQTGLWSFLGLQQAFATPRADSGKLVSIEPCHWVRHTICTAGLVFIWLTSVMTANLLALNLGLTIYLVVGALYEERKLVRVFGEEYVRYPYRGWLD